MVEELKQFAQETGIEEFIEPFIQEGFDTVEKFCALTEEKLVELGVEHKRHRRKILKAIASKTNPEEKLPEAKEETQPAGTPTNTEEKPEVVAQAASVVEEKKAPAEEEPKKEEPKTEETPKEETNEEKKEEPKADKAVEAAPASSSSSAAPEEPKKVVNSKAVPHTLEAIAALDSENTQAAKDLLTAALKEDADFIPALLLLRAMRLSIPRSFKTSDKTDYEILRDVRMAREIKREEARDFAELLALKSSSHTSLFTAGLIYVQVFREFEKAIPLYQQASAKSTLARSTLASALEKGEGTPKDPVKALELYRLASRSSAIALCNLGLCYKRGIGTQADQTEAVNCFRGASEAGSSTAMCFLALCMLKGEGTAKDLDGAIKLFKTADAEQGDPFGLYNLAQCMKRGEGVPKDPAGASKLLKAAADRGHNGSAVSLALCYLNGEGVPKNAEEAVKILEAVAAQGDAYGQFNLALCFEKGLGMKKKNLSEAARLFKMASDQGNPQATYCYAKCLWGGDGVKKNRSEAAGFFKIAADQGHASAQYTYGKCLADGEGVKKNKEEAMRYYKLAAAQGNTDAQKKIKK